jgi:hypothetical protein
MGSNLKHYVSDVTTPYGSKPRASGMTQVCRPTPLVRFMHRSETSSKQLLYRMARAPNSVAFLPMTLCHGTHRNAIWLKTCKRTDGSLSLVRTHVNHHLPAGSAAFIPTHECGGLPPRKVVNNLSLRYHYSSQYYIMA